MPMTTRMRKRFREPDEGYARSTMRARGLPYVFLAVVAIGVGVIASGIPSRRHDPSLRALVADATNPSSTTSSSGARNRSASPTTSARAHDRTTVTVLVVNGTAVNGAATKRADQLG